MYQLKKAYLEITNVCDLHCEFCPGTRREPGLLSPEGFRITCPFSPVQPFALAFVALLCRAEHGLAVLEWTPPQEPV